MLNRGYDSLVPCHVGCEAAQHEDRDEAHTGTKRPERPRRSKPVQREGAESDTKYRARGCTNTGAESLNRLRRLAVQSSTPADDVDHERGDRRADHIRVQAHQVRI